MEKISIKNAILYKDMTIKVKKSSTAFSLFWVNLIFFVACGIFLLIYNGQLVDYNSVSPQAFIIAFTVIVIFESAIICLTTPSITAPLITGERERQTLDVLLTTGMTHMDIILGKYLSAVTYLLLCLFAIAPFLSIVLIYGGLSVLQFLAILATMVVMVLYLSSFGVYFSTALKKSGTANIVTFLVLIGLLGGTILFFAINTALANLIYEAKVLYISQSQHITTTQAYAYAHYSYLDLTFFVMFLNPATTVYDAVSRFVGFGFISDITGLHHGMSDMAVYTTRHITSNNFIANHWAGFGCLVQLAVTVLMLKASARALDPTKNRGNRGKKANK